MKKTLIIIAVFTGMVAGGMVFSSFAAPNKTQNTEISKTISDDDGWEDYTSGVEAMTYEKRDGEWVKKGTSSTGCIVQRRTWCGSPEYRISPNYRRTWYAVSESPVDGYMYCYYVGSSVNCFNM